MNNEKSDSRPRTPKALLVTLGTGPGVEHGIARSIHSSHPDLIGLIATKESLATIARVEATLGYTLSSLEPFIVEDGDDIEECWATVRQAIDCLVALGYRTEDIFVDFTSGTKAMSSGAVLAAVGCECGGLVYVTGRRDSAGRVASGTEKVVNVSPSRAFIETRRKLIQDYFNLFQYRACLELISEIGRMSAEEEIQAECRHLENLTLAYSKWDRFDHPGSLEHFRLIPRVHEAKLRIDTGNSKEMVSRLAKQRLPGVAPDGARATYSEETLADLLCNADRRAEEGKFDDAIARLYRAVELLAQIVLLRHGIDTSRVSQKGLPWNWQEEYAAAQEPIKFGQEKSYLLLEALGEEIGKQYCANKSLRNYLGKRNSSILAHGLEPMSRITLDGLREETSNLAILIFPHLDKLISKCRFPKLQLG